MEYSTGQTQEVALPTYETTNKEEERKYLTAHTPSCVMKAGQPFQLMVYANKTPQSIYIQIQRQEHLLFSTSNVIKSRKQRIEISPIGIVKYLPQGGVLTLNIKVKNKIIGERLIFMQPLNTINITLRDIISGGEKEFRKYTPGEKVNIGINVSNVPTNLKVYANIRVVDTGPFKEVGKGKEHPFLPTLVLLENELYRKHNSELLFPSQYILPFFKSTSQQIHTLNGGNFKHEEQEGEEQLSVNGIFSSVYIYIYRI